MHNDKGLHTVNKLCYTDTAIPVHKALFIENRPPMTVHELSFYYQQLKLTRIDSKVHHRHKRALHCDNSHHGNPLHNQLREA